MFPDGVSLAQASVAHAVLLSLLLRRQVSPQAGLLRGPLRPGPRRAVLLSLLRLPAMVLSQACHHRCPRRGVLLSLLGQLFSAWVLLSLLCRQVGRMGLVQMALLSLLGQLFSVWQTSRGSPVWEVWVARPPANGSASFARSALAKESPTRT